MPDTAQTLEPIVNTEEQEIQTYGFTRDDIIALAKKVLKEANIVSVPSLPADANEKTYVLKATNGKLDWVEEE